MSPAGSSGGKQSGPAKSSPVSPAQFSLKEPCTLWTIGPRKYTLTSA